MNIHARSLRYFDTIRRCGSIREAARRLSIDSSALNRQLLAMEREVGALLFERLRRGLRLTPAGEIFSRHVTAVLQEEQRTAHELESLKGEPRGKVMVMSTEGLNADLLPSVLAQMSERYPRVEVTVHSGILLNNMRAVIDGDVDVALGFALLRSESLRQVALGRFRMGAVMRPGHPLARKSEVSFAQCAEHRLILSSPDLPIHLEMRPLLSRHKGALKIILETSSVELAKGMAALTSGIAFQTTLGMERELRERELVYVPLSDMPHVTSELGVYIRAGRSLPSAVDAFIQLLADALKERESQANSRGVPRPATPGRKRRASASL